MCALVEGLAGHAAISTANNGIDTSRSMLEKLAPPRLARPRNACVARRRRFSTRIVYGQIQLTRAAVWIQAAHHGAAIARPTDHPHARAQRPGARFRGRDHPWAYSTVGVEQ